MGIHALEFQSTYKWSFDLLLIYTWGMVWIYHGFYRKSKCFKLLVYIDSPVWLSYQKYTTIFHWSPNNVAQLLLFYSFPTNSLFASLDFGMPFGNWAMFSLLKLKKKKEMINWNNTAHYSDLIMFVIHHPVIWGNFLPVTFHHAFLVTYGPREIVLIQSLVAYGKKKKKSKSPSSQMQSKGWTSVPQGTSIACKPASLDSELVSGFHSSWRFYIWFGTLEHEILDVKVRRDMAFVMSAEIPVSIRSAES